MDFLNSYAFEQMAREYNAKYNKAYVLNKKDDKTKLEVKNDFEKICRLFCMLKNSFANNSNREKNYHGGNCYNNDNVNKECVLSKEKKITKRFSLFNNRLSHENSLNVSKNNIIDNEFNNYNNDNNYNKDNYEDKYKYIKNSKLREVFVSFDNWEEKAQILFEQKLMIENCPEKTTHKECAIILVDLLNRFVHYIDSNIFSNSEIGNLEKKSEDIIFFEKSRQLYLNFFEIIKNFYMSV